MIKTLEDLSHQSKNTVILLSYEERESEEKKKLVDDFMSKIQNMCSLEKVSFDDYREDFRWYLNIIKLLLFV